MSTVSLSATLMGALIDDADVADGVSWVYAQESFLGVELSCGSSGAIIVALAQISATPGDGFVSYDANVHLNSDTIGDIDDTFDVLAFQELRPKLEEWRETWSSRLDDLKQVGPALKQLHHAVHESFTAASQSEEGRALNIKVYDSLNPKHCEFFRDTDGVNVTRGETIAARGTDPYMMVVQSIVLEKEAASANPSAARERITMTVTPGIRIALGVDGELSVSSSHTMVREIPASWEDGHEDALCPTSRIWSEYARKVNRQQALDQVQSNDSTVIATAARSLREAYRRQTVRLALEYLMTDKSSDPEPLTRAKSNLRRAYTTRKTSKSVPRR
jgi:hypothetical protein